MSSWRRRCGILISFLALACLCADPHAESGPFHLEPAWDYPVLGIGLAAAGSGYLLESRIAHHPFDPSAFNRADIPVYDRWAASFYSKPLSTVSDILIGADGLAPLFLNGLELRGGKPLAEAWTDLILYGEVVAYASTFSLYSKILRVHPRPLAFNYRAPRSERESGDARSSFFSEHTTGAFAAAVFTGYVFQKGHEDSPWIPWVWTGAVGTAAGVGALRVFSGKHFPSDVLAGAMVGSLVGYVVPWMHLRHGHRTASNRSILSSGGPFDGVELGADLDPGSMAPRLVCRLRI